uniref:Variant surface glycoprotein 1134 n=1 Tax=Trypanosoma brucei TaxID=5691 RepID=M4SUN7_9TRYP|nr:variant surface glycoprotein 1134 [Trypanosoma brucei]
MLVKLCLILGLLLSLLSKPLNAAINAGDNKPEFDVLCEIVRLSKGKPKAANPIQSTVTENDDIQKLNMTLSTKACQDMFKKPKGQEGYLDEPPADKKQLADWIENWPYWKKAAEAVSEQAAKDSVLQQAGLKGADNVTLAAAKLHLQAIAATALRAQKKLDNEYLEKKFSAITKAQGTLREIVYGKGDSDDRNLDASKVFKDGTVSSMANACEGAGAGHPASTVVATALCLCAKAASGVEGSCTPRQTHGTQWDGNKNNAQTQWNIIKKNCDTTSGEDYTAATATDVVRRVRAMVHAGATDGYVGTFLQNNCQGNAANGICVKYTGYAADKRKFTKAKWFDKLTTLATSLEQAEIAAMEAATLIKEIKSAKDQAFSLGQTAHLAVELAKQTASPSGKTWQTNTNQGTAQIADKQKLCDKHHDSKTDCDSKDFCTYDKTKDEGKRCVYNATKFNSKWSPCNTNSNWRNRNNTLR